MLERTFQHLPGIGRSGERALWSAGITDWNRFLATPQVPRIGAARKIIFDSRIRSDLSALKRGERDRFHAWPIALHHRALPHIEDRVYLDIETYGVRDDRVTLIALSDGDTVRLIDGTRTDATLIRSIISRFEAIITFNGNRFDIPYLTRVFGTLPRCFLIDLEPLCARAGLSGGLKRIEEVIGIERETALRAGDPLALWRRYRASGDEHFLDLLAGYVEQDVLSLPIILEHLEKSEALTS